MYVHRSDVELVVQAPAKLNLFFEVLAKRSDGYHEIETLMCPVSLYDTLLFQKASDERLRLVCHRMHAASDQAGPNREGTLPEGQENLVLRAVALLRHAAGVDYGATIGLVKRIPIAAGLGGGSSDAAAALVAANEGWGLGWSLPPIGRLVGPDWAAISRSFSWAVRQCAGAAERRSSPWVAWPVCTSWSSIRPRAFRRPPCMVRVGPPTNRGPRSRCSRRFGGETSDGPVGCCSIGCSRPPRSCRLGSNGFNAAWTRRTV